MKKLVWSLVLVAFAGFGLLQIVCAEDTAPAPAPKQHHEHKMPEMKTFSGTIKVDGDTIKLVADDGTYVLKSRDPKALDEYKAKDGQKVEIKGFSRDKDGVKTLFVFGAHAPRGEGHGKHGKKADKAAPAAPAAQ